MFIFDMSSCVIYIAIDVSRALLLVIITPALGFNTANVLQIIAEADPIRISVIFIKIFFIYELSYFFGKKSL